MPLLCSEKSRGILLQMEFPGTDCARQFTVQGVYWEVLLGLTPLGKKGSSAEMQVQPLSPPAMPMRILETPFRNTSTFLYHSHHVHPSIIGKNDAGTRGFPLLTLFLFITPGLHYMTDRTMWLLSNSDFMFPCQLNISTFLSHSSRTVLVQCIKRKVIKYLFWGNCR